MNAETANDQSRIQIGTLENRIVKYHVPRALRPIGDTILSTIPLVGSLIAHTAWQYFSPETHPKGLASINHTLAALLFAGYNGFRILRGDFEGLGRKYKEYRQAEDELAVLKSEYEKRREVKNESPAS